MIRGIDVNNQLAPGVQILQLTAVGSALRWSYQWQTRRHDAPFLRIWRGHFEALLEALLGALLVALFRHFWRHFGGDFSDAFKITF